MKSIYTIAVIAVAVFQVMSPRVHAQSGSVTRDPLPPMPERPSFTIARRVPKFGGMFVGQDKALHYYVLDTSPAILKASETAITEVLGRRRIPAAGFHPEMGQYAFTQLHEWHNRHHLTTLGLAGVVSTGIR